MHFKNGRAAAEGDHVVGKTSSGNRIGVISELNPQAATDNATLTYAVMGGVKSETVTIAELYHAEDALQSLHAVPPVAT
jgi:hypothetical protein